MMVTSLGALFVHDTVSALTTADGILWLDFILSPTVYQQDAILVFIMKQWGTSTEIGHFDVVRTSGGDGSFGRFHLCDKALVSASSCVNIVTFKQSNFILDNTIAFAYQ